VATARALRRELTERLLALDVPAAVLDAETTPEDALRRPEAFALAEAR